jgi:predicted SnoaL-like aldol condensation-catalyzing enzyme
MNRTVISSVLCILLTTNVMAQSQQEKNKKIVERFLIAYIETDLNTIAEVVDRNVSMYMFGEPWLDYDGLIAQTKAKKGTGEKIDFEDMVAEGNKVAVKCTSYYESGIYKAMIYSVIENEKIVEWWAYLKKTGENPDLHTD